MIEDFVGEYRRYKVLAERAIDQLPDAALNVIPAAECNSVAMIAYHVSGNLKSRFTDFLTTDGEKPWRNRDDEFENRECSREEIRAVWDAAWGVLERQLANLTDADLTATVTIRNQPLSVHAALCRSLAHVAYHVGQIVLLARMSTAAEWRSLSIPKGQSTAYNANPTAEKAPR
jgi:hypothetical protein